MRKNIVHHVLFLLQCNIFTINERFFSFPPAHTRSTASPLTTPASTSSFSTILLEFTLQSFVALNAKDGEASILEGLRQSEEHRPEDALGGGTDGEEHLGKGQYIERYAARQHDDACPERQ